MMTKKQARRFSQKISNGLRPHLPMHTKFLWVLTHSPDVIKSEMYSERIFQYGTTTRDHVRRLKQAGLLNEDLILSPAGKEYAINMETEITFRLNIRAYRQFPGEGITEANLIGSLKGMVYPPTIGTYLGDQIRLINGYRLLAIRNVVWTKPNSYTVDLESINCVQQCWDDLSVMSYVVERVKAATENLGIAWEENS